MKTARCPLRKLLRSYKYKYNLCAHVVNHGVAGRQRKHIFLMP